MRFLLRGKLRLPWQCCSKSAGCPEDICMQIGWVRQHHWEFVVIYYLARTALPGAELQEVGLGRARTFCWPGRRQPVLGEGWFEKQGCLCLSLLQDRGASCQGGNGAGTEHPPASLPGFPLFYLSVTSAISNHEIVALEINGIIENQGLSPHRGFLLL